MSKSFADWSNQRLSARSNDVERAQRAYAEEQALSAELAPILWGTRFAPKGSLGWRGSKHMAAHVVVEDYAATRLLLNRVSDRLLPLAAFEHNNWFYVGAESDAQPFARETDAMPDTLPVAWAAEPSREACATPFGRWWLACFVATSAGNALELRISTRKEKITINPAASDGARLVELESRDAVERGVMVRNVPDGEVIVDGERVHVCLAAGGVQADHSLGTPSYGDIVFERLQAAAPLFVNNG